MKFNTKHILRIISLILVLTIGLSSQAQKVGVVLSGGGASGLAHIGFLKALEENNIPIDYITGTSMGALVGGLYASGYSPDEIEHIFESKEFQVWLSGRIAEEYTDYFKKNQDDASWVRIKFTLDSLLESNLPTNLINSTSLDFGLAQLFSGANAVSNSNFDSLFIPFRCLASDISSKKALAFKDGDLATAVRASISYPFFLNPVNLNGKLLYDGGLYDNFPVTTLCDEFEPDIVLGCNVSYNFSEPDEDNILSQLRSMMSYNTNYNISCKKGFIVEPEVSDLGVLDYKNITSTVYEGYQATSIKIDSIKSFINDYREVEDLEGKRDRFKMNMPEISITKIDVEGLSKSEERYVRNFIRFKEGDSLSFDEAKSKILKLASDEMIRSIYPELEYNKNAKSFSLNLKIKKEKKLFISFGGVISTKGINEGFVALQYNYFARNPTTLYANTYFGSFYSSGFGMVKVDIPLAIPLQIHGCYTLNKWDYFQNTRVLVGDVSPSYLIQRENFGHLGLSLPVSNKSKLCLGAKSGTVHYEYYQDNDFTRFDTTDETDFNNYHLYASLEKNSLNRKQYANRGSHLLFQASMIDGEENTVPGSASPSDSSTSNKHSWIMFKARIDHYFNSRKKMKFGFLLEGVYSEQPFFSNYASTILSSPSFEPTPESKTVFRSKYRAPHYGALGLKGIYTPFKNFDVRLETYLFQPFKQIEVAADYKAKYDLTSTNRYFIGSFTLNYNLAFTQVAVNVNYYDNLNENFPTGESENFTVMLHLGFILFNKKMLE